MKKVLFFFPHNPYPPKTGAHKRCLELLYGLSELGCQVLFASSTLTDSPWSEKSIERIHEVYGCTVRVYSPNGIDNRLTTYKKKYFPWSQNDFNSHSTIGMKYWFSRIAKEFQPDVLFINYAYFDGLISSKTLSRQTSVIEIHDLVTLNLKMQNALLNTAGRDGMSPEYLPEPVLDLDFFRDNYFTADQNEFDIYDKYTHTVCISEGERKLVAAHAPHTRALHLPMTHDPCNLDNDYSGPALFTLGPNLFNIQGYCFFREKVIPRVLARCPDFQLNVTGTFYYPFAPRVTNGILYRGFVDDLRSIYENAAFFVCPVFGGTGQQVKIVEAMAHGLPVVALRDAADNSPLRHEVNGLIANTVDEFAEYVMRLWQDRIMCLRFGEEARNTIAKEYSRELLISGLAALL